MRNLSRRVGLSAVLGFCLVMPPWSPAQSKPSAVTVREGQPTMLNGKVQGYSGPSYLVHAEAGQKLQVSLQKLKGSTLFNVYAPGVEPGQGAIFRGDVDGDVADLNVMQAGDYRIDLFQMRASARRGAVTNFTLKIALQR